MNDLISVIIPVYNVEPYLRRCVDSILAQSYQNFEILLIDDGSTDASGDICDEYAEQDSRIIAIHQENNGVSSARNAGLDKCCGEYISFIDSDDWIKKDMYRDMIQAIKEYKADFAVCNEIHVTLHKNDKSFKRTNHWPELTGTTGINNIELYEKVFARTAIMRNKVFKRSIIGKHRWNPALSYGEDVVFFLQILAECNCAVIIPESYYNYFINRPGNVVSSVINEKSFELLNNTKMVYLELSKRGFPVVGISRLNTSIYEVIEKIPISCVYDPAYGKYITACKMLARLPSSHDVVLFLKSSYISLKGKCSYLLMRTDLALWLKVKRLAKKAKSSK